MTEQEMWEAVQRSDASYDGLFFYAVKTTGIFCRSDLLEYQPMREIASEIKARLDKAVSLDDVGLTPRRMTDIFKQQTRQTPTEYRKEHRVP